MKITVFGTGKQLSKTEYKEAYNLGKNIGLAGHVLKNGGYGGVMEASSRGCKDVGGRTIGVCLKGHGIAEAKAPNKYIDNLIIVNTLNERVQELLRTDQVVVLPGKIGTLEEFFTAWAEAIATKQGEIYLVGNKNKKLLEFLLENDFIGENRTHYIKWVESIKEIGF